MISMLLTNNALFTNFNRNSLQETGILPTHKNIRKSEKIVRKGYANVFYGVELYVGKTESGEAFPTREQHGVGNASPDVVDGVRNTSSDVIFW